MQTIIIFLVVIIVLVVGHELGHFFVAKAFRVRVDEFGVGYPPRAKTLFIWRGTTFTLNWLPFGGFVKIFGEEKTGEVASDSFSAQKMYKRLLIVLAGILANLLLAIILYSAAFSIGFLGSPSDFPGSSSITVPNTLVTDVVPHSPADIAGIKSGDEIKKLFSSNGEVVPHSVNDVVTFVKSNPEKNISITIKNKDAVRTVVVLPKSSGVGSTPSIGVALADVARIRLPLGKAITTGFKFTFIETKETIFGIGHMFGAIFTKNSKVLSQVSGPVGIAKIAGQAYTLGIGSFLSFMALISINLAVINLLPFPALDGGRFILELFTVNGKSRISQRVVSLINQGGFIILICLMLFVTFHDIWKIFA